MSGTTIWIKPSKVEIEMPSTFNAKALKAIGWKKKPGPKAAPQPDLNETQNTDD